jgi:hypothetical protein
VELRDRLRAFVQGPAATDPRDWCFFFGPGPSEEEWERLRQRGRVVCGGIERVLREAEGGSPTLDEAVGLEVDVFWARLRGRPTVGNPPCRAEGCTSLSINSSIYCARHHYEQMQGKPPPEG